MTVVKNADDDVLDLLDHAWQRLAARMDGLGDDEWRWHPLASDSDVSIQWRLEHLVAMLTDPRNAAWLGSGPCVTAGPRARPVPVNDRPVGSARSLFVPAAGCSARRPDLILFTSSRG